jgi:hypothetical protein
MRRSKGLHGSRSTLPNDAGEHRALRWLEVPTSDRWITCKRQTADLVFSVDHKR